MDALQKVGSHATMISCGDNRFQIGNKSTSLCGDYRFYVSATTAFVCMHAMHVRTCAAHFAQVHSRGLPRPRPSGHILHLPLSSWLTSMKAPGTALHAHSLAHRGDNRFGGDNRFAYTHILRHINISKYTCSQENK